VRVNSISREDIINTMTYTEHFTFPDTTAGLTSAFETTLALRRFNFRTRLATRDIHGTTVHTVIATPPPAQRTAFHALNRELNRELNRTTGEKL
jgi:hypothetical protein